MASGPSEPEDMGKEYRKFSRRQSEFAPAKVDANGG
jgi:hypothetical protein